MTTEITLPESVKEQIKIFGQILMKADSKNLILRERIKSKQGKPKAT